MENPKLTKESNAVENSKVLFDCIDADAHGVGSGCFFTGRDVIGRKLELQVTNSHSIACKLVKTPQATKKSAPQADAPVYMCIPPAKSHVLRRRLKNCTSS